MLWDFLKHLWPKDASISFKFFHYYEKFWLIKFILFFKIQQPVIATFRPLMHWCDYIHVNFRLSCQIEPNFRKMKKKLYEKIIRGTPCWFCQFWPQIQIFPTCMKSICRLLEALWPETASIFFQFFHYYEIFGW